MSRLFIGDSNIYRHVRDSEMQRAQFRLARCTRLPVFQRIIGEIPSETSVILVSALSNFICDASRDDGFESGLAAMSTAIEVLRSATASHRKLVVMVVPPLIRFKPSWFQARYGDILSSFNSLLPWDPESRLIAFGPPSLGPEDFETDQVHLLERSALKLHSELFEQFAKTYVEPTPPPVGDSAVLEDIRASLRLLRPVSTLPVRVIRVEEGLARTNQVVSTLAATLQSGSSSRSSILTSAALAESQDFQINRQMECVSVLINLPCGAGSPARAVDALLREVYSGDPIPSYTNLRVKGSVRSGSSMFPPIEIEMSSSDIGLDFRSRSGKRRKSLPEVYKRLFVANWCTKGTRIRIDVLKAICKKLSPPSSGFVIGYLSRPKLVYRPSGQRDGKSLMLDYVAAVDKFGDSLSSRDLKVALDRARTDFPDPGMIERYFIVLKASYLPPQGQKRSGADDTIPSGSRKRPREEGPIETLPGAALQSDPRPPSTAGTPALSAPSQVEGATNSDEDTEFFDP